MNKKLKNESIKKLRSDYQSIGAPDWLLRDTMQKAQQQQDKTNFNWMVPVFMSIAALALLVILIPQQSVVTKPTLKSPSLAGLDITKLKPKQFSMPTTSAIGWIPTIPKTPVMPKRKQQATEIIKQDSLFISISNIYKEKSTDV